MGTIDNDQGTFDIDQGQIILTMRHLIKTSPGCPSPVDKWYWQSLSNFTIGVRALQCVRDKWYWPINIKYPNIGIKLPLCLGITDFDQWISISISISISICLASQGCQGQMILTNQYQMSPHRCPASQGCQGQMILTSQYQMSQVYWGQMILTG